MKLLTPILFFGLAAALCGAPRVSDSAHLLSTSEADRLASNIGSRPIYIDTEVSIQGDIKSYADAEVQRLSDGHKAVVIVITTQPHSWRISTYPKGFISNTQAVGDAMANLLRQGRMFDALNGAARSINDMVMRPTSGPSTRSTTTTVTTHTSHTQTARPVVYTANPVNWTIICWIIGAIILIPLAIWAIVSIIEACTRSAVERVYVRDSGAVSTPSMPLPAASVTQSTARQYYDQYSPAQRQAIVSNYSGSPYYHGGLYNDPMQFYMFLLMANALTSHSYYGAPYGAMGGGYGSGAGGVLDDTTTTTTTTTTQSDDSGSGGGWGSDSRPNQDDNSGSGGSWESPRRDDPAPSSSSDFGSSSSDWGSGGSSDSGGPFDSGGSSGGGDSGGGW